MRAPVFVALAIFLTGCEMDSQIAPAAPVIVEGSDFDFQFVGDWIAIPRHPAGEKEEEHVYIGFDKETKEYQVRFDGEWPFEMTARAVRIAQTDYALIDLTLKNKDGETHRIGYALQEKDQMYVWWVSEKRLASVAKANNLKVEFERFPLMGTVVKCDPSELLQVALENPKALAGSTSEILRRHAKPK